MKIDVIRIQETTECIWQYTFFTWQCSIIPLVEARYFLVQYNPACLNIESTIDPHLFLAAIKSHLNANTETL